jgi:RES domain-containing protein
MPTAREQYGGAAFRQCHPDHTDFGATLRASLHHPFRFNPPGEFGVLYVALNERTALAELERQADRLGISITRLAPRLMLHLEVSLGRVLDLTDEAVRETRGISLADLASDDYARCQAVARAARRDGYEAIRYPSATGQGENLAIFMDRLESGSSLRVVERRILPLHHDRPSTG